MLGSVRSGGAGLGWDARGQESRGRSGGVGSNGWREWGGRAHGVDQLGARVRLVD
jgi:hypothetical protein